MVPRAHTQSRTRMPAKIEASLASAESPPPHRSCWRGAASMAARFRCVVVYSGVNRCSPGVDDYTDWQLGAFATLRLGRPQSFFNASSTFFLSESGGENSAPTTPVLIGSQHVCT